MPLLETTGAASSRGFGQFAQSAAANYIEDVFQTWLYTGNGSSQTITNGVDLASKGGLVLTKARSAADGNVFIDTAQGDTKYLTSVNTNGAANSDGTTQNITGFNSNGYSLGTNESGATTLNTNAVTYVSWTFRKQPKFFDVVTYTGNGSNRTIAHSLGSVPGCIIVKRTDTGGDWQVYHRSLANTEYIVLNTTAAKVTGATSWNSTTPTSTVFSLGTNTTVNANGGTYVAYLFAHNAGGFGASGTDNVISCGSYVGNGSTTGQIITLGYEPQWLMIKNASQIGDWVLVDSMRRLTNGGPEAVLLANSSNAETSESRLTPLATGFELTTAGPNWNTNGDTYIYIAIRRGPMRTPTTGTSVFSPNIFTTNDQKQTTGFPVDMLMGGARAGGANTVNVVSRLQGLNSTQTSGSPWPRLVTSSTSDESSISGTNIYYGYDNTGYLSGGLTGSTANVAWSFSRAPGFFDVVCYTGDGNNPRTISHNLTAVPQLMIVKTRSAAGSWYVYDALDGAANAMTLESSSGAFGTSAWSSTTPTSSVFTIGNTVNGNGITYVAYLFATVAGVSKVGSYTGTGTTLQVNCGFTGGARFVLIKRTDSTGDWYVWDSARGIVAGNDPYLLLNSTAAEVTGTDYVDTFSSGFEISSTAPAAINANGGTFIFLAIA